MPVAKLFKVNKLGPVGLLAAIACFVGIVLPWKQTQHGFINGTLEPMGWIMAILIVLYILLLFANFKWNILVGLTLLIMSIYEWVLAKGEVSNDPTASVSYGLYVIMISSGVMILSKLLLFRKKKNIPPGVNSVTEQNKS
jgi:hypothetical protein